eukprot:scaffold281_cov318-Pavlova_lutheri.AAC.48
MGSHRGPQGSGCADGDRKDRSWHDDVRRDRQQDDGNTRDTDRSGRAVHGTGPARLFEEPGASRNEPQRGS